MLSRTKNRNRKRFKVHILVHIQHFYSLLLEKITNRVLNENSIESKENNRAAALTCLKIVVEKAEEINVAKYEKIIIWSDGCSAQFRSRFVFRLLTDDFFYGGEFTWNDNKKKHGKGPMDGVGGTVKNIIFCKFKLGFVTIDSLFEFHQAILKFVPSIGSAFLIDTDVLNEPENIEQESKNIPETFKVHHVERLEVKGVNGKFFYLDEDEQPFCTQWYSNGKDVVICGDEIADVDGNHCALCLEEYQQRKEEWIQCPGLCQQWYHEQCFFN